MMTRAFRRVVSVSNEAKFGSAELRATLAKWAHDSGAQTLAANTQQSVEEIAAFNPDLIVSFGGDGTLLEAASKAPGHVPVLGINLGRLGYLAQFEPSDLLRVLDEFDSVASIEKRAKLRVVHTTTQGSQILTATNDVVLERLTPGHVVRLNLSVRDLARNVQEPFLELAADGVIFATPTGSTAYNLSMRGPIIDPLMQVFVVTPVAPHVTFDRSVVFANDKAVRVNVLGRSGVAVVVDGRVVGELHPSNDANDSANLEVQCDSQSFMQLVVRRNELFSSIVRKKFAVSDVATQESFLT